MFIYREALITTRTHILPKGNLSASLRINMGALSGFHQGRLQGLNQCSFILAVIVALSWRRIIMETFKMSRPPSVLAYF